MKAVLLCGGDGTRLFPCTIVVNKHLLPIYDQPMIYYPIQTLVKAGVTDLLVVVGGKSPGDFLRLLRNGQEFGLQSITYAYQDSSNGIAGALSLAKSFVGQDKFLLILGDNLVTDDLSTHVQQFQNEPIGSAKIFLKEIDNPQSFGVAEVINGRVVDIVEKPQNPKTNLAVIGIYLYDYKVFDIIAKLKPSARGELEITDVNQVYVQNQSLTYAKLDSEWLDTGTVASLHEANCLMAERRKNNH